MTKNYGTVQYNGGIYILLEDAFPDRDGRTARPVYRSYAIRKGDIPDYMGFVPVYRVTWHVLDQYISFDDRLLRWREIAGEDVDEYDLCDWDSPADVFLYCETLWEEVIQYAER